MAERTSERLVPVCILTGGLGTRLGGRTRQTPKGLVEVAGAPFIFHQLALLRRHGAERAVLCVGHLGEQVEALVGDGSRFGLEIEYSYDGPVPIGTAAAVRRARPLLGDVFFVLYGDTYLRIAYGAVQRAFNDSNYPAIMTVLRNDSRWDTSNVAFEGGRVKVYDKQHQTPGMRWIDYGLGIFEAHVLQEAAPHASDLADVYRDLATSGRLGGFEATERFYEIGTPEALAETARFLSQAGSPSTELSEM